MKLMKVFEPMQHASQLVMNPLLHTNPLGNVPKDGAARFQAPRNGAMDLTLGSLGSRQRALGIFIHHLNENL